MLDKIFKHLLCNIVSLTYILTTTFPMLFPLNKVANASNMFSNPSNVFSRYFNLP